MSKIKSKPFSFDAFVAAGARPSDLVIDSCLGGYKANSVILLGSDRFSYTGLVVSFSNPTHKDPVEFTVAFNRDGSVNQSCRATHAQPLRLVEPKTDLEVANEKLASATAKLAVMADALKGVRSNLMVINMIAERTERKYGTGVGMAKVQDFCIASIKGIDKAIA